MPLGMGSRKYPMRATDSGNSRQSRQYQPIEQATPTNSPARPGSNPLRQLTPSIRQAQATPTVTAGANVSSSSSHQRKDEQEEVG